MSGPQCKEALCRLKAQAAVPPCSPEATLLKTLGEPKIQATTRNDAKLLSAVIAWEESVIAAYSATSRKCASDGNLLLGEIIGPLD